MHDVDEEKNGYKECGFIEERPVGTWCGIKTFFYQNRDELGFVFMYLKNSNCFSI